MFKKITKSPKQDKSNKFDLFFETLHNILGELKTGHIAFLSGVILLLGIIFQLALVSNFLGENSNYFSFMTLDNTLLFSLLFASIFIIGAIFPPFFIFAIIGVLITDDKNYQIYIMFGGVIIGIVGLFFEGYKKIFSKHLKIFGIIYLILFLIGSFIYYYKVLNTKTSVEIITSESKFQAKLSFSNGNYYFIEKDGEKLILNSRDVKSIKILQTGEYKINICNNTEVVFDEVTLHHGLNYSKIDIGECSEYKERDQLYRYFPMTIYTTENDINNKYMMFPTDYVGEELFESGKYSIYVNDLLKENMIVEYNGGIEFEIK